MILLHLNYLAVIVATLVYFGLGGLWYSVLFVKPWMAGHNIPAPTDADKEKTKKEMPRNFLITFICCLLGTMALAYIETALSMHGFLTTLKVAILATIFASIGIALNHLYTGKKFKLFLIDAGYQFVGLLFAACIYFFWIYR